MVPLHLGYILDLDYRSINGNKIINYCRGICIGLGCLSVPFSVIIKFLKEELCYEFGSKEVNPLSGDSKVM